MKKLLKNLKLPILLGLIVGLASVLSGCDYVLLDPKGIVAAKETKLLVTAVLLMLIVVIPVILMTFAIARRYRASNEKAKYDPSWSHSTLLEIIWWTIPLVIIVILGWITWVSTHDLDPYKPLESKEKPVVIQVVALNWKWLFIYPKQGIATVNYIQFPEKVPVNFKITADAPMNSFMIPALGGQIYAMAGMQTKLHLMSDHIDTYRGQSVSYSGAGFSGMIFKAVASSKSDFDQWVKNVKKSSKTLDMATYEKLTQPSEYNKPEYFSSVKKNLYATIMMKYMMPNWQNHDVTKMPMMKHMLDIEYLRDEANALGVSDDDKPVKL